MPSPYRVVMFVSVMLMSCASTARADTPATFLKLDDDSLNLAVGRPCRLTLQIPEREVWADANIARLQVRTFGKVETLTPPSDRSIANLTHVFAEPGFAMILLAAGPGSTKGFSDSLGRTPYCAKLLVRVDDESSLHAGKATPLKGPGFTAKAGLKTEVLPLIDPATIPEDALRTGADLPVRVYFEGAAQKHVAVTAFGPGGIEQTLSTDSVGSARFRLTRSGRWLIRYSRVAEGITYTGDLIFDVGRAGEGE